MMVYETGVDGCPECGAAMISRLTGMTTAICPECGHDRWLAYVREEQGQRAASDLDDYDDRYDARSGMAGLVSFSDSFAMDR